MARIVIADDDADIRERARRDERQQQHQDASHRTPLPDRHIDHRNPAKTRARPVEKSAARA